MSDPARQPDEDREAAVREWEQHHHHSLVADGRKKKAGGIAMVAIAAAVLGAAGYIKHVSSEPAKPAGNSDLSIAERKPVPKLKDQEAAGVPVAASAPAAPAAPATTPASAMPGDDPMAAQREQMEMQRQEQARRMLEARMKSAIIAPNTNNPAAGARGDAATVVLLAGVGMQSRSWDQVSPEALFHIVAAMRAAGLIDYARMIAVEAVSRTA